MKNIFILIVFIIMLLDGGLSAKADDVPVLPQAGKLMYLMDYPDYQMITPDNIKSLTIRRYTEAGAFDREVEEEAQIIETYNYLKQIVIAGETKYSCTDNTTMYFFTLKDDSKVHIEIECDWVVLKGKNYNIFIPPKEKKLYTGR